MAKVNLLDSTTIYEKFLAANRNIKDIVSLYLDQDTQTLIITVEKYPEVNIKTDFLTGTPIKIEFQQGSPAKLLYASQLYMRIPPVSKIEGGHPIWHPANGWGTIAFAHTRVKFKDHLNSGRHLRNIVMSCNHIIALLDSAIANSTINSFRSTLPLTLDYWWPVTNLGIEPVDIAFASTPSLSDYIPTSVRGLGLIGGVDRVTAGDRIFKCGAATSITTGVDDGKEYVRIPAYGRFVNLRRVNPGFADVGDSGSAVLNKSNKLVGLVVAGRETVDGLYTYYLPVIPFGGPDEINGPSLKLEIL